ncbi:MAG: hypothetical protein RQ714_08700 [Nitrosomonas sp.]|nr:hypothetical protein [Nitrosomonas sp.]
MMFELLAWTHTLMMPSTPLSTRTISISSSSSLAIRSRTPILLLASVKNGVITTLLKLQRNRLINDVLVLGGLLRQVVTV